MRFIQTTAHQNTYRKEGEVKEAPADTIVQMLGQYGLPPTGGGELYGLLVSYGIANVPGSGIA